ncbi:hypothetical protein HFO01_31985 [Rhizobium laguerreae]|nr:hypothetical protein [Rhizobium laguerreae]
MRMVRGLATAHVARIVEARADQPFDSLYRSSEREGSEFAYGTPVGRIPGSRPAKE